MTEAIYRFDWNVFQFIEDKLWNPVLDTILKLITATGKWGAIYMVLAVGFFIYGFFKRKEKYKKAAMAVAFSIVIMEILSNVLVKDFIARPRPFILDWSQFSWAGTFNFPDIVSRPSSYSFPSGHASSAFAASFAICRYDKKWGIGAYIFAAIMAFSRVYLHVHYCSDVIGGLIFGILYGIMGYLVVKLVYNIFDKYIFSWLEEKLLK